MSPSIPTDAADSSPSSPDREKSCPLIIDMVNPFTFPDADQMFPAALQVAEHICQPKQRARAAGIPTIYVNDNFGKCRHDLRTLVASCLAEEGQ